MVHDDAGQHHPPGLPLEGEAHALDIVSLFPEFRRPAAAHGVVGRAASAGCCRSTAGTRAISPRATTVASTTARSAAARAW